jgi:hypothetical protein
MLLAGCRPRTRKVEPRRVRLAPGLQVDPIAGFVGAGASANARLVAGRPLETL